MNKKLVIGIGAGIAAAALALGLGLGLGLKHKHTYSDKWTNDATYHWHAATCEHKDEVSEKAEHTLNGNECTVCGYKKPEEKPQTVDVTEVTLGKTELTLTEGGEETLTVTVKPDNATDKTVVWTSSDENVATVSDGKVTAISAGNATITAKSGDKSATCAVTVNKKQPVYTVTEEEWKKAFDFLITKDQYFGDGEAVSDVSFTCNMNYNSEAENINAEYVTVFDGKNDTFYRRVDTNGVYNIEYYWEEDGVYDYYYEYDGGKGKEVKDLSGVNRELNSHIDVSCCGEQFKYYKVIDNFSGFTYDETNKEYRGTLSKNEDLYAEYKLAFSDGKLVKAQIKDMQYGEATIFNLTFGYDTTLTIPQEVLDTEVTE